MSWQDGSYGSISACYAVLCDGVLYRSVLCFVLQDVSWLISGLFSVVYIPQAQCEPPLAAPVQRATSAQTGPSALGPCLQLTQAAGSVALSLVVLICAVRAGLL